MYLKKQIGQCDALGRTCKTDENPDLVSYILARETSKQVGKIISKSDKGCPKKGRY